MISPEEQIFIRSILFSPDDPEPKLVYADWLEERNDARAPLLRMDAELLDLPMAAAEEQEQSSQSSSENDVASRRRELAKARAALLPRLDRDWVQLITDGNIRYCDLSVEFEYICPKQWSDLQQIEGQPNVRFCSQCSQTVHYCQTIAEAKKHVMDSRCIAVDAAVADKETRDIPAHRPPLTTFMTLGIAMMPDEVTESPVEDIYEEPPPNNGD